MNKKCLALILSGMLLGVLPGVALSMRAGGPGGPAAPPAPFPIVGKVIDSQGKPASGAQVAVYEIASGSSLTARKVEVVAETTTGSDGSFTFPADKSAALFRGGCVVARKEGLALGWSVWARRGEQRFDITLEEPKDLSGQVVDEQGQPVAEAEVSIDAAMSGKTEDQENMRAWMAPGIFNTKTDSGGRFVFAGLPARGTFEFLVRKPGYDTLSTRSPTFMGPGRLRFQFAPGQAGIKLALSPETGLRGLVVEKATGKPVRGIAVVAEPAVRAAILPPKPVVSGADGTFRIGDLSEGDYTVRLNLGRTAKWAAEPVDVTLSMGQVKNDVKIQLVPGGVIQVLVKDAAGQPVPRIQADIRNIERERPVYRVPTDANGLAQLRVTPGQYVLARLVDRGRPQQSGERITVTEGQTQRLECAFGATPKLAGIVRDEAGNPLAGVKISVLPSMALRTDVTTDGSGKFEADWNPGLGLQARTLILVARDVARNLAAAVDLSGSTNALDIRLKPAVVIAGTVLSQEGKPLPEARILALLDAPRGGGPLDWESDLAKTGPEGKFEIKAIPPGRQYTVSAGADGYGRQEVRVDARDLKDNHIEAGPFKLLRANLSIAGLVVDPNGKPVAGATVVGYGDDQPDPQTIQTDAEGRFTLQGVCPGIVHLQVNARAPIRMFNQALVEAGATDARIVISKRPVGPISLTSRKPTALKGAPLPSLKDLGMDLPAIAEDKMLLVCFWDLGQRPARNCLRQLAARASQLAGKGVMVVPVHVVPVEDGTLRRWLETNKIPFRGGTLTGDPDETMRAWGVASLPHLILTDKKHIVVAEGFGLEELKKLIDAAGR
jgi:protocatechuate 3,4-dioxygenase beta subunit